jgi:uncharacterized protein
MLTLTKDQKSKILNKVLTDKLFELIVMPTEKCNFRCTYCYEDYALGRMSSDTIMALKNLILSRINGLEMFHLSWFGGEPLLNLSAVKDLTSYSKELCEINGTKFVSSATTNGHFLDRDVLRDLTQIGVSSYQISLDGPKEIHDKTRLLANGSGTFDKIWVNLLSALNSEYNFKIKLRIHFDAETHKFILDFVDVLRKTFLHDDRFEINFKPISRLGGVNDHKIKILSKEDMDSVTKGLYSAAGITLDESNESTYVCYASRANSLLVRADGRIGKCTTALYDERNTIGKLLPDGKLFIDKDKFSPWLRGIVNFDLEALSCPFANM